ncbi:hypothetical protein [Streptomyces sp. bgisy027]|uniref:hypothetical protein n=1 Tax=Streptomyces sp. bgisy027 TaxID=3413770 RepID=UPI003D7534C0
MPSGIETLGDDDILVDITLVSDRPTPPGFRLEVSVAAHRHRVVFSGGDDEIRAWDELLFTKHLRHTVYWSHIPSDSHDGLTRTLFYGEPGVEFHTEQKQIGTGGPPGLGDEWPIFGDVLIAIFGAGGAGTVLAAALKKFFTRHQGKKVAFRVNGNVESIHGYSAAEVERIVKATQLVMQMQHSDRELDPVQQQLRQLLSGTTDLGEEEPGSGDHGDSNEN